jgi:hypothetical protein
MTAAPPVIQDGRYGSHLGFGFRLLSDECLGRLVRFFCGVLGILGVTSQYSIFGNEQELNTSAKCIDMACFVFSRGFLGTILYSNTHFKSIEHVEVKKKRKKRRKKRNFQVQRPRARFLLKLCGYNRRRLNRS